MGNGIGKSVLAFILLAAAGILLMAPGTPASARTLLYVGNSQGDDISVIDVAGRTLLTTIKVGALVHGVCAPADGRQAYATIESNHTVQVIDTLTNRVSATIPLPGRPNLVVTRDKGYAAPGAEVFGSVKAAIARGKALATELGADELMIVGGAEIYRQSLAQATRIYLTEVHARPEGDAHFTLDRSQWREVSREAHKAGEKDTADYSFVVLERKA